MKEAKTKCFQISSVQIYFPPYLYKYFDLSFAGRVIATPRCEKIFMYNFTDIFCIKLGKFAKIRPQSFKGLQNVKCLRYNGPVYRFG